MSQGELFSEPLIESLFPMEDTPLSEISSRMKGTSWSWNMVISSPGSSQERSWPSPIWTRLNFLLSLTVVFNCFLLFSCVRCGLSCLTGRSKVTGLRLFPAKLSTGGFSESCWA